MELNTDQNRAVELAASLPFSLITGGAGVGKTTVIKTIAANAAHPVELCCPTGKAAARLREASELPARTVHSLLGYDGSGFRCRSLAGMHVIVDEASMLDSGLLATLIRCRPKQLTLVGDEAQLPPVGKGQPFHDLVALRPDITANLTVCYRNREAIFAAAGRIRNGETPKAGKSAGELFVLKDTGTVEESAGYLKLLYECGEIDFQSDIVLAARNHAVELLNEKLLKFVNPHDDGETWKVGDRVICTLNFPNYDVWNGTTGRISAIDTDGHVFVRGDMPFYDAAAECYLDEIEWRKAVMTQSRHAYALTVHKSQGSQYRKVFIVLSGQDGMNANRALIYTAVTRARTECHILGEVGMLKKLIATTPHKNTVLQQFAAGRQPIEI